MRFAQAVEQRAAVLMSTHDTDGRCFMQHYEMHGDIDVAIVMMKLLSVSTEWCLKVLLETAAA